MPDAATRLTLDDRQRAMLAEMGVRVWLPPLAAPTGAQAAAAPASSAATTPATSPAITSAITPAIPPVFAPASKQTYPQAARPRALTPVPTEAQARRPVQRAPRPEGIEQMDWPALQAAASACRACDLCASRTHSVFGAGAPEAEWMVIGEAPGEHEDRQGQPFVGPAGQLLDNMLGAIGLSRQSANAPPAGPAIGPGIAINSIVGAADSTPENGENPSFSNGLLAPVYIANVLKCRPPGNRNPQPQEVAQCEAYLRRQVALVQPRIILAMGRFAVQSLLQTSEPIGRLRGRIHHYAGVPVVVTYHPAYLLRNLADKAKAWDDLLLARQTVQSAAGPR